MVENYLSWNLIGADGMLVGLLAVAEEVADVDEGQRDAEPHGAHAEHRGEGNGAAGMLAPDEEVDEDPHREHQARVEGRRQESRRLS